MLFVRAVAIGHLLSVLSTCAFTEPAEESLPTLCTKWTEVAEGTWCHMPADEEETGTHTLAGESSTIEHHRVLSPGVTFYDNQASFDAATFGAYLVCEDFSDSPVNPGAIALCDVTEIDSTTTPNNCITSMKDGLSISSARSGRDVVFVGQGFTDEGDTTESIAVGPDSFADDHDISFTAPTPTTIVSMDHYVSGDGTFNLQLFDIDGNVFASQQTQRGFVGIYSETPISKIRLVTDEGTFTENICFGGFSCGASLLSSQGSCGTPLQCCDPTIGLVGPDCCGSVPFDPAVSACCGDGTIVLGTDINCAPSGAPSASPTSQPSAHPSLVPSSEPSPTPSSSPSSRPSKTPTSEPTWLTCDLGPVCDYDFKSDGNGGIEATETYFAVCEWHDDHYHQGCYPESLVKDVGPGQVNPSSNREIVACGCCPEEDVGGTIAEIRGRKSTPVCDGALDCFAVGAAYSGGGLSKKSSKASKKVKFETCIDGDVFMEDNFYKPEEGETVSCGDCTPDLIIL